jgi:hypothetical protein
MKPRNLFQIYLIASLMTIGCFHSKKREVVSRNIDISKSGIGEMRSDSNEYYLSSATNTWDIIDSIAKGFRSKAKPSQDLKSINADFLDFYEKFISDSLFQYERIKFHRLTGIISECDTTITLNSSNWLYKKWNFILYFNKHEDPDETWSDFIYSSDSTFYYEFILEEVGMVYQAGFEKLNESWYLTFYCESNC